MVLAIAATLCATGLMLFLQHRALSALKLQTRQTLQQISEQAAADVAIQLRRLLDGPVFDTLTGVNHPELRAGRLDLVAREFEVGLRRYPHVDRFLAWHVRLHGPSAGDVVFYGRDGGFTHDLELGRMVLDLARRHSDSQNIYVAADALEVRRQLFLRLFWTDARRIEYFAILGFVIDPETLPARLFDAERREALAHALQRRVDSGSLHLNVRDERGALIYGDGHSGPIRAQLVFPMLFYPGDDIGSRLAGGLTPRPWRIEVSADDASDGVMLASYGYGLTAVSLALMLVALGLTVQAHRRSAELARMQVEFVAHVSHQLKTPLSLLTAATETLQMGRVRSPEKQREYLDTIHGEAARLSSLVQRVLEFSRVRQQRSYEFERVALGRLARETVEAFARGVPARRFRCELTEDGDGPWVHADPAAIEQVLANLLDNAVKYSGDGSLITVRVGAERTRAALEVSDEGIGIAPGDRERIFDRFYRAPGASSQGFGLGLTIARELLHAHGGVVEVDSQPGRGSTFRVLLPLDAAERRRMARSVQRAQTGGSAIVKEVRS
jgi:signal transduction histidine kinase